MPNIYQTAAYHALRRPQAVAIEDGTARLGFAEFTGYVRRQASWLKLLGVARGDRVCAVLDNSIAYLSLYHATALLGFILVPVNTRLSAPELSWLVGHCRPKVVLFDDANAALVAAARAEAIVDADWIALDAGAEVLTPDAFAQAQIASYGNVEDNDVALIIYTSGTTSRPKGAMLTHGNLAWNAINYQIELALDERSHALLATPLFHIGGFGVLNGPVLYAGGSLSVISRFDPDDVLRRLAEHTPTHLFLLSAMWVTLTDYPGFAELRFPDLRYVQTAAAPLAAHRQELIRKAFPNAEFGWGFGMTETCVTTLKNRFTSEIVEHPGAVGYGWRHVAYRLADEDGKPLDDLVGPGELQIKGPTVFAGYWDDKEATEATLGADGWLRTGDLFRFDDQGYGYFIGRAKDMVKTGGENVAALEVENYLVQHPGVSEAAVFGVPHDYWGEELRAAIVAVPGQSPGEVELRNFCREGLSGFKVPKKIAVVAALPKSSSGKIQKFKLREINQ